MLRDKAIELLGEDVILYTTDGAGSGFLIGGKIPGVYATVDFGADNDPASDFHQQRLYEPRGDSHFHCILTAESSIKFKTIKRSWLDNIF